MTFYLANFIRSTRILVKIKTMKNSIKSIALILLLGSIRINSCYAQPTFVIDGTTYGPLPLPETCINTTCLNGSISIAEQVGEKLKPSIAVVRAELATLKPEAKKLKQETIDGIAAWKPLEAPMAAKFASYDEKTKVYNAKLQIYNQKAGNCKDQAELNAANQNKAVLDKEWEELHKIYLANKAEYDKIMALYYKSEESKKKYNATMEKIKIAELKLKEFLKELKKCEDYSVQAREVAKKNGWTAIATKKSFFGSLEIDRSKVDLNGEIEEIKKLAAVPWE